MKRPLRRTALLALSMLVPATADGQGEAYGRIAFSTTQAYEDNLFAAPLSQRPEADLISRFGSALEAGYRSSPFELGGRYAIDAERSRKHAELNRAIARQDAAIELRYLPIRRLALDASASYVDTQTPLELNLESQLALGRVRAKRVTAISATTYEWDRVTRLTVDYELVVQDAGQALATTVHSPRVGLERHQGARTAYRMDYRVRHLSASSGETEASHLITIGWVQEITRLTDMEIDAGPRFSEGAIRPEISVVLRRRARHGELSLAYAQTQTTPLGEIGMVDLRSLTFGVTYVPVRHLTLTAAPGYVRSARDGRHASVRALDVQAIVQVARGLSLVASSRMGRQEGTLAGPDEVIPYRSLSMTLRVAFPGPSRA